MDFDRYNILDPWTLMLPEGGAAVLAVAGGAGKSTFLKRLHDEYRARQKRVLWTQTVTHPSPFGVESVVDGVDAWDSEILAEAGALHVAGPEIDGGRAGLSADRIEELRLSCRPDIVLVECHERCGTAIRRDGVEPSWPHNVGIAILVSHMGSVGSLWGPNHVAGAAMAAPKDGEEPRRITSEDLVDSYAAPDGLFATAPNAALVLPLLTGFGSYRDMDGMFELVARLWSEKIPAVCLAELLGDERRDAADQRENMPEDSMERGERIYVLHPAASDS